MKVEVIGSGSAFSTQRNTSAVIISDEHQNWLIDCGPTIPRALWQRNLDINTVDVIYFTHIHPDHCSGLAALLNQWKSFGRTKPLIIICQQEQQTVLENLVALSIWPEKNICFEIYWMTTQEHMSIGNWNVDTAETQHEVPNRALRISNGTHSVFYSGDGRPTAATTALMHNVDIAFQECASFAALSADNSHGDLPQCIELKQALNLPNLLVYHCWDEYLPQIKRACAETDGVYVSQDGLTIDLSLPTTPQLERFLD